MPWLAGFGLAVLIATVYLAVSYAKRNRDPFQ